MCMNTCTRVRHTHTCATYMHLSWQVHVSCWCPVFLYKYTIKAWVHSSRLVMKPLAGGSAAEATREKVPCSRSDLNVISQTLRGEGWCIRMVRAGQGKRRNVHRTSTTSFMPAWFSPLSVSGKNIKSCNYSPPVSHFCNQNSSCSTDQSLQIASDSLPKWWIIMKLFMPFFFSPPLLSR